MASCIIAYLGPMGSYTYEAAQAFAKDAQISDAIFEPCASITTVFSQENQKEKLPRYMIIPLENSTSGDVYETYKLLYLHAFRVIALKRLEIAHVLIGLVGSSCSKIKTVYSHPQALMQVTDYTKKRQLATIPYFSTADAVGFISKQKDLTIGAIASTAATNYYPNTLVLDDAISNNEHNYTRFLVLRAAADTSESAFFFEKSQQEAQLFLLFELEHDASGQLSDILTILFTFGINMTSIKSRPIEGQIFEYFFVVEALMTKLLSEQQQYEIFLQLQEKTARVIYNVY
ncbi:hypothetical protein AwErysi_06020 [Erysipelotrichaceae bacterium]|nr:hypothetical protein AwErysi_06020 [Erysipelotrichaceae bacterium]